MKSDIKTDDDVPEIDENSSELEIVRHALGLMIDEAELFDLDDEDAAIVEFCKRVYDASEAGDMTDIRREIAECEEDDGDDS